jgi:mannose-6-phosphate isomerase-like protein (cupin superfamily)
MMKHSNFEEVKTVAKPWGQEKWIQQGDILGNHNYVLKEIILNQGFKTSLQVHQYKSETNYILEGEGVIVYSDAFFDCEKYLAGKYTPQDVDNFIVDLKFQKYGPGSVMTIEPGTIHRMIADTDLRFVEASTCHLDDVIRLQDDANRDHGKIESEHK